MADILSFKQKALLMKAEVTYGVDPVPVAGTNGILAMNGSIRLEGDKLEREIDLPWFGGSPHVLVGRRATIEFDFEVVGASSVGTAAPIGVLLKACGMAETLVAVTSATYNPISSAIPSVTIYFWHNGQRFAITGARGDLSIQFDIKTYAKGRARFVGLFAIPTAVALPSPTLSNFQAPPAIETETFAFSLAAFAANAVSFGFAFNNELTIHEGSEDRQVVISDRKPTFTARFYDPGVGVKDYWTIAKDATQVALTASVTGAAGKITTINCPVVQIEMPQLVDIEGATGLEVTGPLIPGSAGSDELSLAFT